MFGWRVGFHRGDVTYERCQGNTSGELEDSKRTWPLSTASIMLISIVACSLKAALWNVSVNTTKSSCNQDVSTPVESRLTTSGLPEGGSTGSLERTPEPFLACL